MCPLVWRMKLRHRAHPTRGPALGTPSRILAFLLLALAIPVRADEPDRTRVLPPGEVMSDSRTEKLQQPGRLCPFKPPATLEEWKKRRQEVREQVLVANGLWPMSGEDAAPAHDPRKNGHGALHH